MALNPYNSGTQPKYDWHQKLVANLLKEPLVNTRLGAAHTSIGHLLKFDLSYEFPATLAKRLFFDQVKRELYCFLNAMTEKKSLHEHGVHIWDDDMKRAERDDIGPIYGYQWRNWPKKRWGNDKQGFDQLRWAINELKETKGTTRRAIVSSWNAPEVLGEKAVLPPCHVLFQFNIVGNTLYTDVYQRSADVFLGLPFDVASFAIMSRLICNELIGTPSMPTIGKEVLNYHIANLHLYKAHTIAAHEELDTERSYHSPYISCGSGIDDFHYDRCDLLNYKPTKTIKAKLLI